MAESTIVQQTALDRYGDFLEATPDPAIVVDRDGLIVLANAHMEALFGYAHEELLGRPVETLLPERFRRRHEGLRAAYEAAPRAQPMGRGLDLYGLAKDGREIPVDVSMSPMVGPCGPVTVCAIRDISYLREAERQIREQAAQLAAANERLELSNRELNDLAGVLAHDLRAPLRHLTEFSNLLIEDEGDALSDAGKEYLGYIGRAAEHMQVLISELLEYARAGNLEVHKAPVALADCVNEVVLFLASAIEASGAEIRVDELPEVNADPQLIKQVFQNLIGNALKFVGDAPPVIHITAEQSDCETVIGVKDNGMGVDPEHAATIFAPFKRAATGIEGTGIGLATCQKAVERHGGRIWVESEPGKGAHFRFSIPRG